MTQDIPNATASTEDFEFKALEEAVNYRAALMREFSRWLAGPVVEVGAGIGQLTGELAAMPGVTRLLAVEPDDGFAAKFRATHPEQELLHGTAAAVPADGNWRALVSVNVLEHIRDDAAELVVWRKLLAPAAGHLCLLVPARQEIYAPLDKDFGHFRRYSKPELRAKLEAAGYEVTRLCYYNFIGYFAWWMNFVVLGQRSFKRGSVRFFDRMIFPWTHALETAICRPPIGQSLLAIAKAKP
jgi:SAM-dependent methyltransferase